MSTNLACLVPCVIGSSREGGPIRLSCWTVYVACRGEAAWVVLCIQHSQSFLYLSAGIAVIGKMVGHVRLLP